MNIRQIFVAALLVVAGAFGSANAQTCFSSPTPFSVSYPTGGSITISYQICGSGATYYWSSTMTYNNVSFDGSYRINGSLNLQVNFSASSTGAVGVGSVVFNGGPLTYSFGATPYTVSFSNLTYNFNSAFQPVSTTGSLTINSVVYPADTAYWAYLFR